MKTTGTSPFKPGFAAMVASAETQPDALLIEALEIVSLAIDAGDTTRPVSLTRSAMLVAYENRHGGEAVNALMDRLGMGV